MADSLQGFEEKMSAAEEKEYLKRQIEQSPEKAVEILKAHIGKKPMDIMREDTEVTTEERVEMEKMVSDPYYREKKEKIGYLLSMFEQKGILPVVSVLKELDPSLEDYFHDILVRYLMEQKNA